MDSKFLYLPKSLPVDDDNVTNYNKQQFENDNMLMNETDNLVTSSGQTVSTSDDNQVSKAVTNYALCADFFTDVSTVANTIVLTDNGTFAKPIEYTDGMQVSFIPLYSNTGAATVNVNGLGAKSIYLDANSQTLIGNEIENKKVVELRYNSAINGFIIKNVAIKNKFTNCILEAPNGVMSFVAKAITIKAGLNVLIPNGRNVDGSLKNIEYTYTADFTRDFSAELSSTKYYVFAYNTQFTSLTVKDNYYMQEEQPASIIYYVWYKPSENKTYVYDGTNWVRLYAILVGEFDATTGSITDFTPYSSASFADASGNNVVFDKLNPVAKRNIEKATFNNLSATSRKVVSNNAMPSSSYVDLTLGVTGTVYTAPENGYVCFCSYATAPAGAVALITNGNGIKTTVTAGDTGNPYLRCFLPIAKGNQFRAEYYFIDNLKPGFEFRFYYNNGDI